MTNPVKTKTLPLFFALFAASLAFGTPVEPAKARLLGADGEALRAMIAARVNSPWARGKMYDECANCFRTHADDAGDKADWQNEYWGKTMLCFAGAAAYTGDAELKAWIVRKTHAFLDEFQKPNGYLSTYAKEDFLTAHPEDPRPWKHACFNIWGQKYTLWALIEIHRVTGDARALEAAKRMADHLIAQLRRLGTTLDKTGHWYGISSMSILRPLVELHRVTGGATYRRLADEIVSAMEADSGSPNALIRDARRTEPVFTWHEEPAYWAKAYEIMSCLEGLCAYGRLTGRADILGAVAAYHRHLVAEELNPMGSVGHFDHFVGGRRQANGMTELCDVVHWIRLNRELLLLTGEAQYADLIEAAYYNAFLAGVEPGGRWGAHIIRSHGTRHLSAPSQVGMTEHQCCPDNMLRTFFDLAGSVGMTDGNGTLSLALYGDSDVDCGVAKASVRGGYPYAEGPIIVSIRRDKAGSVRFRIPAWSTAFEVNGTRHVSSNGWHEVSAPAGESVWKLAFDLSPRMEAIDAWGPETTIREMHEISKDTYGAGPAKPINAYLTNYTRQFMTWYTDEMKPYVRAEPGLVVRRGPLVLAKGRAAGTSLDETLRAESLKGKGVRATLRPVPGKVRRWMLTFEKGEKNNRIIEESNNRMDEGEKVVPVSDFANVSNVNDPTNWFSLWF